MLVKIQIIADNGAVISEHVADAMQQFSFDFAPGCIPLDPVYYLSGFSYSARTFPRKPLEERLRQAYKDNIMPEDLLDALGGPFPSE